MNSDKDTILENLERVNASIQEIVEKLRVPISDWRYKQKLKNQLKSLQAEKDMLLQLLEKYE